MIPLQLPQTISHAEALRYLGCLEQPAGEVSALLERCERKILQAARPVGWRIRLPLEQAPEQLRLDSSDIQRHLKDCGEMVLLAVTLGAGVDTLLRRLSVSDLAEASVCDALAGVLADEMASQLEQRIRQELLREEKFCTGRFSPGYGDWPLEVQPMVCRLLDSQRKIGLSCSESCLLIPRKSITAVMGISERPVSGQLAGCGHCALKQTCIYRKRGKTCADF